MKEKFKQIFGSRSELPTVVVVFAVLLLFFDVGIWEIFSPTKYQVVPSGDETTGRTHISLVTHLWWGYGESVYEPIRYNNHVTGEYWEIYRDQDWFVLDIHSKSGLVYAFDAYTSY